MKLFMQLYQHYKDNFDLETQLIASKKTYKYLESKAMNDSWF